MACGIGARGKRRGPRHNPHRTAPQDMSAEERKEKKERKERKDDDNHKITHQLHTRVSCKGKPIHNRQLDPRRTSKPRRHHHRAHVSMNTGTSSTHPNRLEMGPVGRWWSMVKLLRAQSPECVWWWWMWSAALSLRRLGAITCGEPATSSISGAAEMIFKMEAKRHHRKCKRFGSA